jgi:DNA polymerase-1
MEFKISLGEKEYRGVLVETDQEMDLLIDCFYVEDYIDVAIDLETTGLNCYLGDKIAGYALYFPLQNIAFYVPIRHAEGFNWELDKVDSLKQHIACPNYHVIGWNLNFDLQFLLHEGVDIYRISRIEDVMFALHLLDENRKDQGLDYKLKNVAKQFIDPEADKGEKFLQAELAKRGIKKGQMYQLPADLVAEYAMLDVILSWELRQFFMPYLEKWLVTDLYAELNDYLQHVVVRMESNGMYIDHDLCRTSINDMEIQAKNCLQRIQELAGYSLNPNSPAQVKSWLKTKDATKQTLAALEETDERARLIQEYRFYSKAASTFYLPYLKYSEGDGKVHTTIHVTGTTTGRPSFSDPNLGQVPRKGKYEVKRVFIAPDGYYIVQADYAQQELRLAAHYTNETALIDAFNNGIDPHQQTADHVGITRSEAKNYNFATIYGAGARKLAWMTGDTEENARKNLERFDELYPNLRQFAWVYSDTAKLPRNPDGSIGGKYRFVRLPDGRCRHYNGIDAPYYSAFNTLIQGTGAIIMRRALMSICNHFPPDLDVMIPVQTVYDSFICYVRKEYLDEVCTYIKMFMEDFNYNPRMVVDIEYGLNWLELESWNV